MAVAKGIALQCEKPRNMGSLSPSMLWTPVYISP